MKNINWKSLKKVFYVCLILILVVSLCACGKAGDDSSEDTIVIGTTMSVEKAEKGEYNFDMISSGVSQPPLLALGSDGQFESSFVSLENEGKTWKFTMKDNLYWSDGEPLCLSDIELAMESEDNIKSLVASYDYSEDGKTLLVTLTDSNVRFENNLTSLRLLPSHAKDGGKDLWYGPYVFSGFDKNEGTLTFTRNEYFKVKSGIDTVIYQIFNSEEAMYMALTQGDIDTVWNYGSGVPGEYVDLIDENEYTVDYFSASNLPAVLSFNCSSEKFEDENLRLAVSYFLDYQQIVKYLGSESSVIAERGNIPPASLGYYETENYSQNIKLADEYMAKAGYTKINGSYVDSSMNIFEFTLSVNSSKASNVKAAELIKTQLENIGITVNIESIDSTAFNAKVSNKYSNNYVCFEAAVQAFTANGMAMGDGLGTIYVNGKHAVQGCCQVYDEEFTEALQKLSNAESLEEYISYAKYIQLYYGEHTPFIALYWDGFWFVRKNDVAKNTFLDQNFGINNFRNFVVLE